MRRIKRILAWVLVLVMLMSMMNLTAFAEDYGIMPIDISGKVEVAVGEKATLSSDAYGGRDHQWTISDEQIATMVVKNDRTVEITGVSPGSVMVTHEYERDSWFLWDPPGHKTETFGVTVVTRTVTPPESVEIFLYLKINAPDGTKLPENGQGWFTLGHIAVPGTCFSGIDLSRLPTVGTGFFGSQDVPFPAALDAVSEYVTSHTNEIILYGNNANLTIDCNAINWLQLKWCYEATSYDSIFSGNSWHLDGELTLKAATVTVTVNYIYANGENAGQKAYDPSVNTYTVGENFEIPSHPIEGYVAVPSLVSGAAVDNIERTVLYYKDSNGNGVPDKNEGYTVSYTWGGDVPTGPEAPELPGSQSYIPDEKYTLPTYEDVTKVEGNTTTTYTFDGWYMDENCTGPKYFGEQTMANANVTYYGKWSKSEETRVPDLEIFKTVSAAAQESVTPGQILQYTITVSNNGNAEATGVVVTDVLPNEVSFFRSSSNATFSNGTVTAGPLTLAAGESVVVNIWVTVNDDAVGSITNKAEVTSENAGTKDASVTVTVESTDTPAPPSEESDFTLTIEKVVDGNAPAGDVFTFEVRVNGGDPETHVIKAGESFDVKMNKGDTYTVEEVDIPEGYVAEETTVSGTAYMGSRHERIVNHYGSPNIYITKTASKVKAEKGDIVMFTITVYNTGTAPAKGLTVVDSLPAELQPMIGRDSRDYSWDIVSLSPGDKATFTVTATVTQTGTIENTATLKAGDTVVDEATATVYAVEKMDKEETTPDSPIPPQNINVTVTKKVVSTGTASAPDDDVFTFHYTAQRYDEETKKLVEVKGELTLKNGESKGIENVAEGYPITIIEEDKAGYQPLGVVKKVARANENITITNYYDAPVLNVLKTVDRPTANVGEMFEYTITITNIGTADAHNVVVTDKLPDGMEQSFTGKKDFSIPVGLLKVGESTSVTISKVIATKEGTYKNTAVVTADGINEATSEVAVEVLSTVAPSSTPTPNSYELTVEKVVRGEVPKEALDAKYSFTVSYSGENGTVSETFELGNNEHQVFTIPTGKTVTITENNVDTEKYEVANGDAIRQVTMEQDQKVVFINRYIHKPTASFVYTLRYEDNVESEELFVPPTETATETEIANNSGLSHKFVVSGIAPTRSGYVFLGWSREPDSEPNIQPRSELTATAGFQQDITLYAQWAVDKNHNGIDDATEEPYTLTVHKDVVGEGADPEQLFTFQVTVNGKAEDEVRQLKDGEPFTIGNLKAGDVVLVQEINIPEGYTSSIQGDENNPGKTIEIVDRDVILNVINRYTQEHTPENPKYSYTLTYNPNGGQFAGNIGIVKSHTGEEFTYTFTVDSGLKPTREGYAFQGWALDENGTTPVTSVTANFTNEGRDKIVYAIWIQLFTVTYKDGANEEVFEDQVYKDVLSGSETPNYAGTPTRVGYVFNGWKPDVAETVTEDAVYTAQWGEDRNNNSEDDAGEEKFTVTYTDGVGDEVFKPEIHDNLLINTATPEFQGSLERENYVFTGWNPTVEKNVTATVTYAATWADDKNNNGIRDDEDTWYTLTYDANGGADAPEAAKYLKETTATVSEDGPSTAPADCLFIGWSTARMEILKAGYTVSEAARINTVTVVTGEILMDANKTLYAVWALDSDHDGEPDYREGTYHLTYDSNSDGDTVTGLTRDETAYLDGTTVSLAAGPTREGYLFLGWSEEQITTVGRNGLKPNVITKIVMDDNKAVYAVWAEDSNGDGTPDVDQTFVEYSIVRDYYTDDVLEDTETMPGGTGVVGETVMVTEESTVTHNGNEYTLAANASLEMTLINGENVLRLRYERTSGQTEPGGTTPGGTTPGGTTPGGTTPGGTTPGGTTPGGTTPGGTTPGGTTPGETTPGGTTPGGTTPGGTESGGNEPGSEDGPTTNIPDENPPLSGDPGTTDPSTTTPGTTNPGTTNPDTTDPGTTTPGTTDPGMTNPGTTYPTTPTDPAGDNGNDPTVDIPDENPPLSENPEDPSDTQNTPADPADPTNPAEGYENDPGVDIPDENPPLSENPGTDPADPSTETDPATPAEHENPTDSTEDGESDPTVDIQDENVPLGEDPGVILEDGRVPMEQVPQTGESFASGLWMILLVGSTLGLAVLYLQDKKKVS